MQTTLVINLLIRVYIFFNHIVIVAQLVWCKDGVWIVYGHIWIRPKSEPESDQNPKIQTQIRFEFEDYIYFFTISISDPIDENNIKIFKYKKG